MERIFTHVRSRFNLFKQPHKIGDTIDVKGKPLLVVGIENFEVRSTYIMVEYTCQMLEVTQFAVNGVAKPNPSIYGIKFDIPHCKWNEILPRIKLGSTQHLKGDLYKIMEYTGISLVGTDLRINMLARPVYPVSSKEAKTKLLNQRMKKLNLEII